MAKKELLATVRDRYRASSRKDKTRILDEFIAVTGHHRKHGIRLLRQSREGEDQEGEDHLPEARGRRIYDEAVREAVILVWEASDRICGKRLKAALPHLVESMERHGHLDLDPEVWERLLAASAATLDRLLKPVRAVVVSRRKRRRNLNRGRHIPVRTFADWDRPPPGFLEIDLVAHCGDNMGGSFVYSLVATSVCTGWTEAVPLVAREQSLAVAELEAIAGQLPFPVLGIDSDNDTVFINDTLTEYCAQRGIEFTRSRAYRRNDQAWIEQKNGAVIRRFLGHQRYSGQVAGQTIAHLHGSIRLYVNYFQPSFKLVEKTRNGSTVIKRYSPPATPCDRVAGHEGVRAEAKEALRLRRATLDPVALLHSIREARSALGAIGSPELRPTPKGESLERFLARLPSRWMEEREQANGNRRAKAPRTWRTRKDPFEGVWCDVLNWLQDDPDASAVALLNRLRVADPDRFSRAPLRTLQRRVQQWRSIMANKLAYASSEATTPGPVDISVMALAGNDPRW